MDALVCLGLLVVIAPIALIVFGAVQLHKLKKAVAHLSRRLAALEAEHSRTDVAQSAPATPTMPVAQPKPVAPSPVAVPPPLPSMPRIPDPALPKQPVGSSPPVTPPPPPPRPARAAIDWEAFLGIKLFAWIGGFSSAGNTNPPAELVRNPAAVKKNVKLLWLGCGNKDGLLELSEELDAYLKAKDVPHVFHVDGYGHNRIEWSNNLYFFAQRLFR